MKNNFQDEVYFLKFVTLRKKEARFFLAVHK